MTDPPFQRVRRFFAELKRRKVYQVAAIYAAVAFVVVQVANLVFPALNIPSWAYSLIVVLALLGFPLAVVLAWAFEVTPEGVRRTPEAEPVGETEEGTAGTRTGYKALVGLGLIAAAVAGGWYLTGGTGGTSPDSVAARDSARVGARSIAVLPFTPLSEGEESETFARGVHDDLLTRLAHISGLSVISRTAVEQYRDTDLTTGQIADSLGVRWVMEGGVQVLGDQIQVNAQLIDPRTEAHAWADSYQRDLTTEDLFALQEEITRRIARSMETELTEEEAEQVKREPTGDLDAYRLYVQGRDHLDQRTELGTRRAAEYFARTIREDSSYALAWVGLADASTVRGSYGYAPLEASLRVDPERAVRRALALEPGLAEAHASLGYLHMEEDLPRALRELKRAVDLKPSYARAHHWLALALLTAGRVERAVRAAERAVALDPLSPVNRAVLSGTSYCSGRIEEALKQARRAQELAPDWAFATVSVGQMLSSAGRQSEALEALSDGLERSSAGSTSKIFRAWPAVAHARAGDTARARQLLASYSAHFERMVVHAALGHRDEALATLKEMEGGHLTESRFRVILFRYARVLDPLRQSSEYRTALRQVNERLGLNPDGSLPDSVDLSFGTKSDD